METGVKPLLLLARHGQTQGNAAHVFRSRLDFPLDAKGEQDAHELGQFVTAHFPVSTIISSPMKRAMRTAAVVAQHVSDNTKSIPVERDGRLSPWNAGLLTGKKRTAQSEKVRDFYVQHAHVPIPGGESIEHSEQRMKEILEAGLRHGQRGGLALFATHGSGIKAAETLITGKRTPTGDAAMIEPGGLAGIFATEKGYEMRPLFKEGKAGQVTS